MNNSKREYKKNEFIDEIRMKNLKFQDEIKKKVIINNQISSKNYAAGILPCVICEESGEPYFLLGKNGANKFSVFWGWQDKGDDNCEYTACREATEEGLSCFGSFEVLAKALSSPDSSELIFNHCFLVYLG
eukprot:TRINITY_DN17518_c0_g1_i1.p1 TRINITY_DN17518_c0_g1~~TRINITY_DN17518_c0_g1_i1.p1  ORF type:complete len:151 (-),score=33.31 TRINITY_DN17518_c0_g1_i1:149-541(-)